MLPLVPVTPPNPDQITHHPLSKLYPLMGGEEFAALCSDVESNGLQQSIVLFQGQILDGRNRDRACAATGTSRSFVEFTGTEAEAEVFVDSANLYRRHLTPEQRQGRHARLKQLGHSNRAIAKITHFSESTVRRDLAGAPFGAPALPLPKPTMPLLPPRVTGLDGKSYKAVRQTKRAVKANGPEPSRAGMRRNFLNSLIRKLNEVITSTEKLRIGFVGDGIDLDPTAVNPYLEVVREYMLWLAEAKVHQEDTHLQRDESPWVEAINTRQRARRQIASLTGTLPTQLGIVIAAPVVTINEFTSADSQTG